MWVFCEEDIVRKFQITKAPYAYDPENPDKCQEYPDIFKSPIKKKNKGSKLTELNESFLSRF